MRDFNIAPEAAAKEKHLDLSKFYVITPISNPIRFASRYRLYVDFAKSVEAQGAKLVTIEMAFGNRPHKITETFNSNHIQVQGQHEIWNKENLINIAISRLPADWKYVAWVDADIRFLRPDWLKETVQALQHFRVVQMFHTALDLGPNGETLTTFFSFVWCWWNGMKHPGANGKSYPFKPKGGNKVFFHPGYAWGARREAINNLGGLLDRAILGSGDNHMASALVGNAHWTVPKGVHKNYRDYVFRWQEHAERCIRRDIGYVDGSIIHEWHGRKKDRRYQDRWKILERHQFDPLNDLKEDWQGLYQLVDDGSLRSIKLRDDIRKYFRGRNEDSIDL